MGSSHVAIAVVLFIVAGILYALGQGPWAVLSVLGAVAEIGAWRAASRQAVCIRCGSFKAGALGKCPRCGFAPRSDLEQAQSLILSKSFDVGEMVVGRTPAELTAAAKQIEAGVPYAFKSTEVETVQGAHRSAKDISPRHLVVGALKWLGPPALLLLMIYWLAHPKS